MKKHYLIFIVVCFVLFFSQGVFANVTYFSDLSGHWSESYVYYAADNGLIHGYTDGTFCPDNKITRAEFLTILALDSSDDLSSYNTNSTFSDVSSNYWGKDYINWGAANQIVYGYQNNSFLPDNYITRQEMATILYRYLVNYRGLTLPATKAASQFADQANIASWALNAVQTMQKAGIINGKDNNCFDPLSGATRAESATVVASYLKIYDTETGDPLLTTDLYSNGTLIASDMTLSKQNGVLMIAARTFFEAANFRLTYFGTPQLIVADDINNDLEFWIGKTTYYANGTQMTFSVAPFMSNNTTYIPLYEAANAVGLSAVIHFAGTSKQYLGVTYSDSMLTRNINNFYGTATTTSNVSGNVFLANSDVISGFFGTLVTGAMSYGSYTTADGDFYFGNWSGGVMNGAGRSIKSDGEFFVGTFSSGVKNTGTTYFVDGATFTGTWKIVSYAVYPSTGTYTDKNGNVYGANDTTWTNGALTVK